MLLARAGLALLLTNVRYWRTVAPVVRGQLARWQQRAEAIVDPELRTLALQKLQQERFNTEAGAMLATLAPRAQRTNVTEAIVALQVLFDLLDGLTEQPLKDPLRDGERLFGAFTNALHPPGPPAGTASGEGGGYLQELSSAAGYALARLPAAAIVLPVAQATAERAAQAQIRMHATPQLGIEQLQAWAQSQTQDTGLQWRELTAGAASSVLSVHALIAAAGDASSTPEQAAEIDTAYLSICVLLTLLDSLVDHDRDTAAGQLGYIGLYEDRGLLAPTFTGIAQRAASEARQLPNGVQHLVMLTGVIAYYASTPGADGELARPLIRQVRSSLGPLVSPALLVMRTWRLARTLRGRG